MSNNPYAVNGYGGRRPSASSNPYAPTNASNTVPGGRYADPYLNQQNNASSASVNSFGSHERRRRSNPYEQRDRDSPGPPPTGRAGSGSGGGGGGYGGLPPPRFTEAVPPSRNEYDYPRETEFREYEQRPPRPPVRERERGYNEGRMRDGREVRAPMPPTATLPSKPSVSSLNQQSQTNGYGNHNYPPPPPENANRHYSPRRQPKSMEEILRHIQVYWKDMEGDECIPVKIALKLMDPSSLGLADKE